MCIRDSCKIVTGPVSMPFITLLVRLWAYCDQRTAVSYTHLTQAFYKKYYGYALSKENAEQILKGQSPIK